MELTVRVLSWEWIWMKRQQPQLGPRTLLGLPHLLRFSERRALREHRVLSLL